MSDAYYVHPFSIEALTSSLDSRVLSDISATEFQTALLDVTTAEDSLDAAIGGRVSPELGSDGTSPQQSPSGSSSASPVSTNSTSSIEQITCIKLDSDACESLIKKESPKKPQQSFVALISKAILSAPDKRMLLGDIYKYFTDNYPYYNNDERAWRNSIRHNLSINECFIKNGRVLNKGNYWSIHPACVSDFEKGDYSRRQARRRARRCQMTGYGPRHLATDYAATQHIDIAHQMVPESSYSYHPYYRPHNHHLHHQQKVYYQPTTVPAMPHFLHQAVLDVNQQHHSHVAQYVNQGYSQNFNTAYSVPQPSGQYSKQGSYMYASAGLSQHSTALPY